MKLLRNGFKKKIACQLVAYSGLRKSDNKEMLTNERRNKIKTKWLNRQHTYILSCL